MYCTLGVVSVAFAALLATTGAAKCVPPQKNFHYISPCPGFSKPKVSISKITATQGSPPVSVDSRGGIDLTQPLTLHVDLSYKGKPIKSHRMDQQLFKYTSEGSGRCRWKQLDTGGITDDLDMCPLIKNVPCSYKGKPTHVISVIDWQSLWGDAASGMDTGAYYGFKTTERDGGENINCFWIQSKIIKS